MLVFFAARVYYGYFYQRSEWYLWFLPFSVFHTDPDDPSSSDDEGMPYTRPAKFKAAHSLKGPFDFDQIKVVQDLSGEHMVRACLELLMVSKMNQSLVPQLFFFSTGCRLDHEVLSLWEASGNCRPRQHGSHLGVKDRLRLLQ